MIDLVPIARTSVDWETLLPCTQKALGRSISSSLDDRSIRPSGLAAFSSTIAEFARAKSDPITSLRQDRLCLRHVFFTFLIAAPATTNFRLSSMGLTVTRADIEGFAIVSGKLNEWYRSIVDGLVEEVDPDLKRLLCLTLSWFEKEGLSEVWGSHQKHHTSDGLYFLEPK